VIIYAYRWFVTCVTVSINDDNTTGGLARRTNWLQVTGVTTNGSHSVKICTYLCIYIRYVRVRVCVCLLGLYRRANFRNRLLSFPFLHIILRMESSLPFVTTQNYFPPHTHTRTHTHIHTYIYIYIYIRIYYTLSNLFRLFTRLTISFQLIVLLKFLFLI
jgi:hypothetical protein